MSNNIDRAALTAFINKQTEAFAAAELDLSKPEADRKVFNGARRAYIQMLNSLEQFVVPEVQHSMASIQTGINVRRFDESTSWEAAVQVDKSAFRQQLYRDIYHVLTEYGPMTDDELRNKFRELGMSIGGHASIAKRRGELVKAGWVQKTSLRRRSNVGATMTVWTAVTK